MQVTLAPRMVRTALSTVHAAGAIAWGPTRYLHVNLPRALPIHLQPKRMHWGKLKCGASP